MKQTAIKRLIILLVLSFACPETSYLSTSFLDDTRDKLYLVRRIFIEETSNREQISRIEPFLKRELQRWGFVIVEDQTEADAILTGGLELEVIVHGDGSVPDKAIYKYELRLTNNELVWKGKVKFPAPGEIAEENRYAAEKIAGKIAREWRSSARKGRSK